MGQVASGMTRPLHTSYQKGPDSVYIRLVDGGELRSIRALAGLAATYWSQWYLSDTAVHIERLLCGLCNLPASVDARLIHGQTQSTTIAIASETKLYVSKVLVILL